LLLIYYDLWVAIPKQSSAASITASESVGCE
jgi:hypothetical protein